MSDVFTPQLVLDKTIDHCTAITGGGFPLSLYPSKIADVTLDDIEQVRVEKIFASIA